MAGCAGLAGGAVLTVCWLLTGSLWASALMVAVIAMVLLDMAGAMFLAGIQLNAVRAADPIRHAGTQATVCCR